MSTTPYFINDLRSLATECPLRLPAEVHADEHRVHELFWDGHDDSIVCQETPTGSPRTTRQHVYSRKLEQQRIEDEKRNHHHKKAS